MCSHCSRLTKTLEALRLLGAGVMGLLEVLKRPGNPLALRVAIANLRLTLEVVETLLQEE